MLTPSTRKFWTTARMAKKISSARKIVSTVSRRPRQSAERTEVRSAGSSFVMMPSEGEVATARSDDEDGGELVPWGFDRLFASYGPQGWWPAQTRLAGPAGALVTQGAGRGGG